jgi:bifunctional non-homologous end joining protein LigD
MSFVEPMKAQQDDGSFLPRNNYLEERKFDGTRIEPDKKGGEVILRGRKGTVYTKNLPYIVEELKKIPHDFLMDAEAVHFNKEGDDKFDELSRVIRIQDPVKRAEYIKKWPVILYVFDIIILDGKDLMSLPLLQRKAILRQILPDSPHVRFTPFVRDLSQKRRLLADQKRKKREGVMLKEINSPYEPGRRSPFWRKHKFFKEDSAIVIGYEPGEGSRKGTIGALYTAQYLPSGQLWFTGKVGTGFKITKEKDNPRITIRELQIMLEKRRYPGKEGARRVLRIANIKKLSMPEIMRGVWILPGVIVDVKFMELSSGGRFRHGSFQRVRFDVHPKEVMFKGRVK